MKVALVTCVFPPYKSGIGTVAARHARLLTDLGHEVTVFCPAHGEPAGRSQWEGVRVERLRPLIRHGNSALVPQLALRMRGFEAVYIMYPFFGGAEAAALGARLNGVPYFAFFHMDVIWSGWRGRVLTTYERLIEPMLMRKARAVLVSSLEYAHARSLGRIDGVRIQESPYSSDLSHFQPPPAGVPGERPPTILFVGAMDVGHSFKGVPQLIDAFARVHAQRACCLVLVGDGALRPQFEAHASQSGAGDDVSFLGRVDDDALARAYQEATVTVLPSTTGEEAFGIVLVEAMASGCPVIASDLPGVAAVVRSGGGILTPPGDVAALADAIFAVVDDEPYRERLSEKALAGIDRYRPEAERNRLAAALELLSPASAG